MSEELGKEVEQPFWLSMDNAKVHLHASGLMSRRDPPTSYPCRHASADLSTAHCCIHVLPDIETRFEPAPQVLA
jgi:hypothetical protein